MSAPRSLRARIVLAALVAVALAGALAGALLLGAIERDGRRAVDRDLRQRAAGIVARAQGPAPFGGLGPGRPPGLPPPRADALLLTGSGTFTQVTAGGRLVQRNGDVPADPPPVPADDGLTTVQVGGRPWRSITVSAVPDAALRVQILTSLAPVQARVARIRRQIILIGLGALALTGLAAWAFTALTLRPLARLRAGAARVSDADDLGTPLPDDEGPDEVRSLARALNEMLARLRASAEALERALHATRRFAADAGHELRTPLTSMRANLDALDRNPDLPLGQRQALVRELTAEQDRIVHLLEGLQALARGEAAESLPREDVELADLVDAAVFSARSRHAGMLFTLEERIGGATVHGWPSGLRLIVDNLLDNAALHGGAGGGGEARVLLDREGDTLVLQVEDDGPGIPKSDRARLLEPFARGPDAGPPGTGLGLAIVAQQVALHGGVLSLERSPAGGLAVHVRLPASSRHAPAELGEGAQAGSATL